MTTFDTAKSARLDIRLTPSRRELLERAAAVSEKSITEFVLESASTAAENTLLDQKVFFIDAEVFREFKILLDGPAHAKAGLSELFAKSLSWR